MPACGLPEEHRTTKRARDEPGEVAGNDSKREGGVNGDRGAWGEWLFQRLSCRALLAQLQGCDNLRRHARHPYADASRLGVGSVARESSAQDPAAVETVGQ